MASNTPSPTPLTLPDVEAAEQLAIRLRNGVAIREPERLRAACDLVDLAAEVRRLREWPRGVVLGDDEQRPASTEAAPARGPQIDQDGVIVDWGHVGRQLEAALNQPGQIVQVHRGALSLAMHAVASYAASLAAAETRAPAARTEPFCEHCPRCHSNWFRTTDTREYTEEFRSGGYARECKSCGHRYRQKDAAYLVERAAPVWERVEPAGPAERAS